VEIVKQARKDRDQNLGFHTMKPPHADQVINSPHWTSCKPQTSHTNCI